MNVDAGGNLIEFVTVPALQELWITCEAASYLSGCIQRSSCQLTKLVVHDCALPGRLIRTLEDIPTLTTLFVTFTEGVKKGRTRFLFDGLKITDDAPTICPNLTHIAAGGPSGFDITPLLDMVESRWYRDGLPRLSFMRAIYHSRVSPSVVKGASARIDKMKAEGLDAGLDSRFDASPQNYLGAGRP
jgi:hypothetical protein